MPWQAPNVQVKWGPYFEPDPLEQQAIVTMAQAALGSTPGSTPIITRRMAVEVTAPIFGHEDVDAVEKQLKTEDSERDKRAADQSAAETAAAHKLINGVDAPDDGSDGSGDSAAG